MSTDAPESAFEAVLPPARGPISASVVDHLREGDVDLGSVPVRGALDDGDANLALHLAATAPTYRYRGANTAAVESLALLQLRHRLLAWFENEVRAHAHPGEPTVAVEHYVDWVLARPAIDLGPLLDDEPSRIADRLLDKAAYLRHEADAHTLALARLEPDLQRAVAEIQAGEYGVGFERTHAQIYCDSLRSLGADPATAVEHVPGVWLAAANLPWLFASSHRLRGAAVGQLALFELDSVAPCRRAIAYWDRAGLAPAGRRWFDVHAVADEEHAELVRQRLLPRIAAGAPELQAQFRFGVEATWMLQERCALDHRNRWTAARDPAAS